MLGAPLWFFITFLRARRRQPGVGGPAPVVRDLGMEPAGQRQWLRQVVPLLLAKPVVRGVIYNQLCDAHPHEFTEGDYSTPRTCEAGPATLAKVRESILPDEAYRHRAR